MKLSTAKTIGQKCINNNLSLAGKNARDPQFIIPYLEGGAGLGKTTVVGDITKEMGIGMTIVSLAQYDPAEIAGWTVPNKDTTAMIRLRPDWMPTEGKGVVYLDELPQAITANQNIAAQIVNERRVGPHKIPEGWTVVAAGNKSKDRAGTNHMPTHLRDRMTFLEVEADLEDTIAYFFKHGVDPRVCAFLRFKPTRLHEFDRDANACPSPRSWERTSTILNMGLDDMAQHEAVAGTIGQAAATDIRGYLNVFSKIPKLEDIIKSPDKTEIPSDPGILYALSASLAANISKKNVEPIMAYMNRLKNKEFIAYMIMDAGHKSYEITESPAFRKFMLESGMFVHV